jgi:DNA-binding NarL/FixJ family response regulator
MTSMPTTVLIVDDHPSFRSVARMLLESEGYDVVGEAPDGEAALRLAGELSPDVVLLDLNMPGGGGVRAATEIREGNPDVKLVALTADNSRGAQYDMSRAGAVGFVFKGAGEDEILRVIRSSARW